MSVLPTNSGLLVLIVALGYSFASRIVRLAAKTPVFPVSERRGGYLWRRCADDCRYGRVQNS